MLLLVAIHELVPWLHQWHDAHDANYGMGLGTYFKGFVDEEARSLGLTTTDLDAWTPAERATKAGRKAKAAKNDGAEETLDAAAAQPKTVRKPPKVVAPEADSNPEALPKKRRTGAKKAT